MSVEETYARRSARVLLFDAADRILLLRYYTDHRRPKLGFCWFTPGGAVDDGETLGAAAARELREEIGLVVTEADLGSRVAVTSGPGAMGRLRGLFRDDFFLLRVDAHEIDTSGLERHERKRYTGHRWWTVADLGSTTELIYPAGLAGLLVDLVAGRVPKEPVRLPWQH